MSRLKIKKFLIFPVIVLILGCNSTQIKKDPAISEWIQKTKRVVVVSSEPSNLLPEEASSLVEIFTDQLRHHKEFIVYPSPKQFTGKCDLGKFPKIEGIFRLSAMQILDHDKGRLNLVLNVALQNCQKGSSIWEGTRRDWYPTKNQGNESLKKTYTQKYGKGVEIKVSPYFWMSQVIMEDLPSPILEAEEEDEKIEVESY
jgi:probable lipoprotein (TIGR04455 family)